MSVPRPEVIFFDLDETLIVNGSSADAILQNIYRECIGPPQGTEFAKFMEALFRQASQVWNQMHDDGRCGDDAMIDCFGSALQSAGEDGSLAERMFEAFVVHMTNATRLSENAMETLELLREQGRSLGIITNGFERIQLAKIGRHNLSELVDTIVVSEQAGAHKPSPKVFNYALELSGHVSQAAWHVGDSLENDVSGAIGAGLTAVHYDPSGARAGEQPGLTVSDLLHLVELQ